MKPKAKKLNVREYVLADRQWPRHLRIAHAKMQLMKSKDFSTQEFWRQVLVMNEDERP